MGDKSVLQVVSAAPFEAEPLLKALQYQGIAFRYHATGVGAIHAAQTATALAEACNGCDCLYVGTAGSFVPFQEVTVFRAGTVSWSEYSLRTNAAYVVPGSMPHFDLTELCHSKLRKFPAIGVLGSTTITSLAPNLEEVAKYSEFCETLELYSLCAPFSKYAKTFSAILGITNQVGPKAHEHWRKHHIEAAEKSAKLIAQALIL